MKPQKNLIILLTIFLLYGCTKEVDFDQIDDASVETSYIVTLVNAEFSALDFLNPLNEEIPLTFDVIRSSIDNSAQDYLEKVEVTVLTENTFNRNSLLSFQMFNNGGELIYQVEPTVEILPNSVTTTILEIPQEDVHFLFEARYFGFTFVLIPTNVTENYISPTTIGTLSLKSSMELFFNFRKI